MPVKKSSKFGLILSSTHAFAVFIALMMSIGGGDDFAEPLWIALLLADLPISVLWFLEPVRSLLLYIDQAGLSFALSHAYYALVLSILGGAWWYTVGWLIVTCSRRLAVCSARNRFVAGLMITTVILLFILAVQFAATFPNTADDGCVTVGFPLTFFSNCYWSGIKVSGWPLALDGFVWLVAAILFSYYLSGTTRQSARSRS